MSKNRKLRATAVLVATATAAAPFASLAAPTYTVGSWVYDAGDWKYQDGESNYYSGWIYTSTGWYYLDPATQSLARGWKEIDGRKYYFSEEEGNVGALTTGWILQDGKWYFLNNDTDSTEYGAAVRGWNWIDQKAYYFEETVGEESAQLYVSTTTADGYTVNADGQRLAADGSVEEGDASVGFSTALSTTFSEASVTAAAAPSRTASGSSSGGGSSRSTSSSGSSSSRTSNTTSRSTDTASTDAGETTVEPSNGEDSATDSTEASRETSSFDTATDADASSGTESSDRSESASNAGASSTTNASRRSPASNPSEEEEVERVELTPGRYVLMNIPYDMFYSGENINNDVEIDAVASTTKSKTRTGTLVAGSYHQDIGGSDISGVTFPVLIGEGVDPDDFSIRDFKQVTDADEYTITVRVRGQEQSTSYQGRDALFENESFAYYALPDGEVPSQYKVFDIEDGVWSFSEIQGSEIENVTASASLSTSSSYGDYQLGFDGLDAAIPNTATVYGAVVHTTDGTDYAMRHLENIWLRTQLAWSSGVQTVSTHGNTPLQPAHYISMMGKTISGVTFYTSNGTKEVTLSESVYVPVKFANPLAIDSTVVTGEREDGTEITAVGFLAENESASVSGLDALPEDFIPAFSLVKVEGRNQNATDEVSYADGSVIARDAYVGGNYRLVVSDASGKYASVTVDFTVVAKEETIRYALMNIPFGKFYENELNNDTEVDAVASVTASKWKNAGMVGGSYHHSDDSNSIDGITYYVEIPVGTDLSQFTELEDASMLFSNLDYAYVIVDTIPTNYKVLSIDGDTVSFSEVQNLELEELADATATLSTSSRYGDYQLNVSGFSLSDGEVLRAVVLETSDGTEYGLRQLENIWRNGGQLAWSVGVRTSESHGNTLQYAHYTSIEGKTITGITYITSTGAKHVSLDLYVPSKIRYEDPSFTIAEEEDNIYVVNGLSALPSDYVPYIASVTKGGEEVDDFIIGGDLLIVYNEDVAGTYTATISDSEGKYESFTINFTVMQESIPARFVENEDGSYAVAKRPSARTATYRQYLNQISSVSVDGTSYNASGRNSVSIVDKTTGAINLEAVSRGNAIFAERKAYDVVVSSTGYPDLSFSIDLSETDPVDPDPVEDVQYVLMNVPYADLYKAELQNNDLSVDAVASVTTGKANNANLVGGSYRSAVTENGYSIYGASYWVAVPAGFDLSSYTQVESVEALVEAGDYAYVVLTETPAQYKTVSLVDGQLSFSEAVTGDVEELDGSAYSITTSSVWGDYQIQTGYTNPSGESTKAVVLRATLSDGTVKEFGLRHLENIWRMGAELAFSVGYRTTEPHGNTLNPTHYVELNGATITDITYYTTTGVKHASVNLYVPIKYEGVVVVGTDNEVLASTGAEIDGSALPFEPSYTVKTAAGAETSAVSISDGRIVVSDSNVGGSYTLTASDANAVYAPTSTTFTVRAEGTIPVVLTENEGVYSLEKTGEASDVAVSAYLAAISSVSVDGTSYAASGRGALAIINPSTGVINTDVTTGRGDNIRRVFPLGEEVSVTVVVPGYTDYSFTITAGEAPAPAGETYELSAVVETKGANFVMGTYDAKLLVTVEDGVITGIEDNGTEPGGMNSFYWNTAWTFIQNNFVGKSASEIANVDASSGATVSVDAVKNAIVSGIDNGEDPVDPVDPDVPENAVALSKLTLSVDGVDYDYYYADRSIANATEFYIDGERVEGTVSELKNGINTVGYFYIPEENALSGQKLYGIANVSERDFYYAEIIDETTLYGNATNGDPVAMFDVLALVSDVSDYDAVSSATTQRVNQFPLANYEIGSEGYTITGTDLTLEIDADLYARVLAFKELGISNANRIFSFAGDLEENGVSTVEPAAYKTVYVNGLLSEMRYSDEASEITSSSVSIRTSDLNRRGNYLFILDDLPEEIKVWGDNANVVGVIIENDEGKSYGLSYLDNIWGNSDGVAYELSFAAEAGRVTTRDTVIPYEKFTDLPGTKITKITYLLNDRKAFTLDVDIDTALMVDEGDKPVSTVESDFTNGEATVSVSENLPEAEWSYQLFRYSDRRGTLRCIERTEMAGASDATALELGVDYTIDAEGRFVISQPEDVEAGSALYYGIVYTDASGSYVRQYSDISLTASDASDPVDPDEPAGDRMYALSSEVTQVGGNFVMGTYEARVKLTISEDGIITEVTDDSTEAGAFNQEYWETALQFFTDNFVGKTVAEIAEIDATSEATVSVNAIKNAIVNGIRDEDLVDPDPVDPDPVDPDPVDPSGPRVFEGTAPVQRFNYEARVIVSLDENGRLVSIEDNNTVWGNSRNQRYWETALSNLRNNLVGLTIEEIKDFTYQRADGESRATRSADAILEIIRNGGEEAETETGARLASVAALEDTEDVVSDNAISEASTSGADHSVNVNATSEDEIVDAVDNTTIDTGLDTTDDKKEEATGDEEDIARADTSTNVVNDRIEKSTEPVDEEAEIVETNTELVDSEEATDKTGVDEDIDVDDSEAFVEEDIDTVKDETREDDTNTVEDVEEEVEDAEEITNEDTIDEDDASDIEDADVDDESSVESERTEESRDDTEKVLD